MDGALMEPSGRNRWQPVANGTRSKTAHTEGVIARGSDSLSDVASSAPSCSVAGVAFHHVLELVECVCPELIPVGRGARAQLDQPSFEEAPFRIRRGERQGTPEGDSRFGVASEPSEELGPGRVEVE